MQARCKRKRSSFVFSAPAEVGGAKVPDCPPSKNNDDDETDARNRVCVLFINLGPSIKPQSKQVKPIQGNQKMEGRQSRGLHGKDDDKLVFDALGGKTR